MPQAITQEEYDASVASLKAGQIVNLRGRRALNIDDLHTILDVADDQAAPPPPSPGIPMILGADAVLGAQAQAQSLQAALDLAHQQISACKAQRDADARTIAQQTQTIADLQSKDTPQKAGARSAKALADSAQTPTPSGSPTPDPQGDASARQAMPAEAGESPAESKSAVGITPSASPTDTTVSASTAPAKDAPQDAA